jgi:type II secretory pathway component GspD/PulD (secretin)
MVPEESDVKVVSLKYAQAALVKTQLDALLAQTRTADASVLNTEETLIVEADPRMNRLMIQNATPRQMRLIHEIVPLLDQPVQEDERLIRRQQVYRPQRIRATEIALVLKDIYRDLLSTSDKVFDARVGNRPFGYNSAMAAASKNPEYQGLLSVGADDPRNILVLSAPAYLIDEVMQVVKLVDSSASRETVAVAPVSRAAHAKLGEALDKLLSKPK